MINRTIRVRDYEKDCKIIDFDITVKNNNHFFEISPFICQALEKIYNKAGNFRNFTSTEMCVHLTNEIIN
jgi:hypothetical protein